MLWSFNNNKAKPLKTERLENRNSWNINLFLQFHFFCSKFNFRNSKTSDFRNPNTSWPNSFIHIQINPGTWNQNHVCQSHGVLIKCLHRLLKLCSHSNLIQCLIKTEQFILRVFIFSWNSDTHGFINQNSLNYWFIRGKYDQVSVFCLFDEIFLQFCLNWLVHNVYFHQYV